MVIFNHKRRISYYEAIVDYGPAQGSFNNVVNATDKIDIGSKSEIVPIKLCRILILE